MGKTAIVIGGSIGGLMHGIMLKHNGYNVTILEQEPSRAREGYDAGIKIGPPLEEFLKHHDRVGRDMVITCTPGVKIDINGNPRTQRGQTMLNSSWGLIVSVLRANFDGFASAAVPEPPKDREGDGKATFRFGTRVTDVKDLGETVEVSFVDGKTNATESLVADMVIVADGSTSSIRQKLLPQVKREYLGYMCWRGTVRESEMSAECNELYSEKATFHLMDRNYLLIYTIPTDAGDMRPGHRLHNWVWYSNLPATEAEATRTLFTDKNNVLHQSTLPRGLVAPEPWTAQQALAKELLPEHLAAIVCATREPFVTKVHDVTSTSALFYGGKVFLVGDAQTALPPNAGMSTAHAANDCNELEKVVKGEMTAEAWERSVLRWAAVQRRFCLTIAAYGLGTKVGVLKEAVGWVGVMVGQKLGLL